MSEYPISDLLKLLQSEGGDRVLVEVGAPPTLILQGEFHAIEGPPVSEESGAEMVRAVAGTREIRVFRTSGSVDVMVRFDGSRSLVRAARAFGEFRLELEPIC